MGVPRHPSRGRRAPSLFWPTIRLLVSSVARCRRASSPSATAYSLARTAATLRLGGASRLTLFRGVVMRNPIFGGRALARGAALAIVALLARTAPALGQFGAGGGGDPMVRIGFGGGVTVPVVRRQERAPERRQRQRFRARQPVRRRPAGAAIRVHLRSLRLQAGSRATAPSVPPAPPTPGAAKSSAARPESKFISSPDRSVRSSWRASARSTCATWST